MSGIHWWAIAMIWIFICVSVSAHIVDATDVVTVPGNTVTWGDCIDLEIHMCQIHGECSVD